MHGRCLAGHCEWLRGAMERDKRDYNQKFVERFLARRPAARARYDKALEKEILTPRAQAEAVGGIADSPVDVVNETIVNEERPVLFVKDNWIDTVDVSLDGEEAKELVGELSACRSVVEPVMPLIGRIDVIGF